MPERKHIPVLWLWMTALLLSTVGISVQQVYCYCSGKTSVRLFSAAERSCATTVKSCCTKSQPAPSPFQADLLKRSSSCCAKTAVQFLHLDAPYTFSEGFLKMPECPIWADELPDFFRLYRPVICAAGVSNKAPPTPPPPLSGRLRCLWLELFRC